MINFLIFFAVLCVLYFGGIFAFREAVSRKMYSWVKEWSKEWGVSLETQAAALQEMQYLFMKRSVKPQWRNFKPWLRDIYWKACLEIEPGIPVKMRLKQEMKERFIEAENERIYRGIIAPEPIVGIFNYDGIEPANEMRDRRKKAES